MATRDVQRRLAGFDSIAGGQSSLPMKIVGCLVAFIFLFIISLIIVISHQVTEVPSKVPAANQVDSDVMAMLHYYEENRRSRYTAYQVANPDMAVDDVVWRVDVNLDRDFYAKPVELPDTKALPLLVNKYYKLPDDFVPERLVAVEGKYEVTPQAQKAYKEMKAAFRKDDMEIAITSAYRSISDQQKLYNRYLNENNNDVAAVDASTARPGHSEHNTGLAIDLIGPNGEMEAFGDTEESTWIAENAYKYGYIVRYTEENSEVTGFKPEPWHITFVGKKAAKAMHDEGIESLEEYVVKYQWYSPEQK
jgi:D-alanyl-D-alanine carboxypeptidase